MFIIQPITTERNEIILKHRKQNNMIDKTYLTLFQVI